MKDKTSYNRLNLLILAGNAGPAEVLANKLEIKPRRAKYMLEVLRSKYDCPVMYNSSTKSYFYSKLGQCIFGFHDCCQDGMMKEIETLRKTLDVLSRKMRI